MAVWLIGIIMAIIFIVQFVLVRMNDVESEGFTMPDATTICSYVGALFAFVFLIVMGLAWWYSVRSNRFSWTPYSMNNPEMMYSNSALDNQINAAEMAALQ